MSDKSELSAGQFADELYRGYRLFKAFEHGIEIADKLKAAEQLEADAKKRAAAIEKDIERLKTDAKKVADDSQDYAKRVTEHGEGIVKQAQVEASAIKADAQLSADAALRRQHAAQTAEHDAVAALAQRKSDLEAVEGKVSEAQAKLDKINADIAKVVAKLGA